MEDNSTTSFLTQLATWHKQELDEKLASRVQVSQRAVAKIIQVVKNLAYKTNIWETKEMNIGPRVYSVPSRNLVLYHLLHPNPWPANIVSLPLT